VTWKPAASAASAATATPSLGVVDSTNTADERQHLARPIRRAIVRDDDLDGFTRWNSGEGAQAGPGRGELAVDRDDHADFGLLGGPQRELGTLELPPRFGLGQWKQKSQPRVPVPLRKRARPSLPSGLPIRDAAPGIRSSAIPGRAYTDSAGRHSVGLVIAIRPEPVPVSVLQKAETSRNRVSVVLTVVCEIRNEISV
jgi:hypothetical protein